jgi:hypothetical protein
MALAAQLESTTPRFEVPWVFQGNGAQGVKTWLSDCHALEINPAWLGFDRFESMALDMIDEAPAPGEPAPQEWRSIFTVGIATDWYVRPNLAFHAGYRFYANPIPADMPQGAYLNADQHVMAVGLSLEEGPHSLSMVYGLDVMDPSSAMGISSARHGTNLPELGHLITFNYAFSF